jgi:hypothetical protein
MPIDGGQIDGGGSGSVVVVAVGGRTCACPVIDVYSIEHVLTCL